MRSRRSPPWWLYCSSSRLRPGFGLNDFAEGADSIWNLRLR